MPLCFSAASIKMVKTNWKVRNISINRPWATEVPGDRAVRTLRGPGKRALITAALVMAPSICEMVRRPPRTHVRAPIKHIPNET